MSLQGSIPGMRPSINNKKTKKNLSRRRVFMLRSTMEQKSRTFMYIFFFKLWHFGQINKEEYK